MQAGKSSPVAQQHRQKVSPVCSLLLLLFLGLQLIVPGGLFKAALPGLFPAGVFGLALPVCPPSLPFVTMPAFDPQDATFKELLGAAPRGAAAARWV